MTQHYLLPCSCGQKVRVANAQAGGQVACRCGNRLAVPTLRGLRELEPAPADVQAVKPGWSPLHGAFFATGIAIATLGVAIFGYSLWRYAQLAGLSIDRSGDVVEFESANIDKLSAVQMISAWSELLDEGLGEKQKPIWIAAKEKLREYRIWMISGGGAVAIGAALSIATLFVCRPPA